MTHCDTNPAAVIITADRGDYGRRARVIAWKPVPGSSQCWLDVDGVHTTVAQHETRPV